MAITSFYLLNMFPRMRTLHHHLTINTQQPITKHVPSDAHFTSSPNSQHPTAKPNMFPRMRTLHHHPIIITHHPTAKHVPSDAHFTSSPNTQHPTAKHVPSDAHFTSSPNNQHPSPNSHERNSIDFSIKLAC